MTKAPKPYAHLEARTERQFETVEAIFSNRSKVYLDRINRLVSDPSFDLAVENLNRVDRSKHSFDTKAEADEAVEVLNEDQRYRRTSPVRQDDGSWQVEASRYTGPTYDDLAIAAVTGDMESFWALFARVLPRLESNADKYGTLRETDGPGAAFDNDDAHQEQAAVLWEMVQDGDPANFYARFCSAARRQAGYEALRLASKYTVPGREIETVKSALRRSNDNVEIAEADLVNNPDRSRRMSPERFRQLVKIVRPGAQVDMDDAERQDWGSVDQMSAVESGFDHEGLSAAWEFLSEREQWVLNLAFGIGGEAVSVTEIAREMGVTQGRASQLKASAMKKLAAAL